MDSKIHIVYIVANLGVGGPQRLIMDMAKIIDKKTYKISIISLVNNTYLADEYALDDVDIYTVLKSDQFNFTKLPLLNLKIHKLLNRLKPQIVHSHLWDVTCLSTCLSIISFPNIKWIHTIHTSGGYLIEKGLKNTILRHAELWTQKLAKSTIITISKAVDDLVKNRFKLKRTILIYNGIDTERFKPAGNLERTNLIYIARNQESKGHVFIIQAMSLLKDKYPNLKLILVGGQLEDQFSDLVSSLNLQANIKFLGARNDVPSLLSKASIGVFPSLFEGMPLALCEMMSSGLPIVAFDIPPVREISDDGACVMLVPVKNIDQLAEKLTLLIDNKTQREELGIKARQRIVENYSIQKMVANHQTLYSKIAK